MADIKKQCVRTKFHVIPGKTSVETYKMVKFSSEEETLRHIRKCECFVGFKNYRIFTAYDQHLGHPLQSHTEETIICVNKICSNRQTNRRLIWMI